MASPFAHVHMPVWQDPFVEVIKLGMSHHNIGYHQQGDVVQVQDPHIHKNVWKIRGAIAATNFLRIPRDVSKGTHGVNLIGRYVYIQLRRIRDHALTFHLEFTTNKKNVLRLTFSTIYELLRSTGTTLPSSLRFPDNFNAHYDWQLIPSQDSKPLGNQIAGDSSPYQTHLPFREKRFSPKNSIKHSTSLTSTAAQSPRVLSPPSLREKASPQTREANLRRDRNDVLTKADQIVRAAGIFGQYHAPDVKILTKSDEARSPKTSTGSYIKVDKPRTMSTVTRTVWPDPILQLKRVIGFSSNFPNCLVWIPDGSACIYTSFSTIIIREFCDIGPPISPIDYKKAQGEGKRLMPSIDTRSLAASQGSAKNKALCDTKEHFLHGHSSPVCGLALSSDGSLLASVETEDEPSGIRLWDLAQRECVVVVKGQAKGIHALCFSPTKASYQSLLLCAAGYDDCYRTQIYVWDCSAIQSYGTGSVTIVARQTCDFPIFRITFSPYEQGRLVSCGRENIRLWRIRNAHLTGCPVILNEYSRGTIFTDMGFDRLYESFPTNIARTRPLYVSSSVGTLLVVDYDSRSVLCVYQLHDTAINSFSMNEGFCVTGSEDHFMRVWPLDFTDFFLEAQHEAGVAAVDISIDGLQILVGSRNGAIGVLDIVSQRYDTILRSHTKEVVAMITVPVSALASTQNEIITTSHDGTLRLWDVSSAQQTYEFAIQKDQVTCLAPSIVKNGIIAVGFASGCTRIFNIYRESDVSLLHEAQQHQSSILHVQFDRDAEYLYTSGAGKQICMYDVRHDDCTPVKMLLVDFNPINGRFFLSDDKRYIAMISNDQQSVVLLHPRSLRVESTLTPTKLHPLHGAEHLTNLLISWNSQHLLALSKTDRLYVYSLQTFEILHSTPLLGQHRVTSMTLSPNMKYLVTGGSDGSVRVWKWEGSEKSSRMYQCFCGQTGQITQLAFMNDGKSIVTTGTSSTIFIWDFHGDCSPRSSIDFSTQNYFVDDDNNKENKCDEVNEGGCRFTSCGDDTYDPEEMSPSLQVPVPSSKPNFRLSLAVDALVLSDKANKPSSLCTNIDVSPAKIDTIVVPRLNSNVRGKVVLSDVIAGLNPNHFAWSYRIGKFIYSINSMMVIEDISTGSQMFCSHYGDSSELMTHNSGGNSMEIILLRLSPSKLRVATISSKLDCISVWKLQDPNFTVPDDTHEHNNEHDLMDAEDNKHSIINLPEGTKMVTALEFGYDAVDEDILCLCCQLDDDQSIVFIVSTSSRSIVTMGTNSSLYPVQSLYALPGDRFISFTPEINRIDMHALVCDISISETNSCQLQSHALVPSFPTKVQLVRICTTGRDRYQHLIAVDNNRYCYFVDLKRASIIATTKFLLLKTKQQTESIPALHILEWIASAESQSIVSGSRHDSNLYVHALPMKSSRSESTVDWKLVARGGLSLLCKIALDSCVRNLSVDPNRAVGVVTTADNTVVWLHFKDPPVKRILKKLAIDEAKRIDSNHLMCKETSTLSASSPLLAGMKLSWALENTLILSITKDGTAVSCIIPEGGREVARFQVDNAFSTCFAVDNAFVPSDGVCGSKVVTGYSDGSLRIFDLCNMVMTAHFQLPQRVSLSTGTSGLNGARTRKLEILKQKEPLAGKMRIRTGPQSGQTNMSTSGIGRIEFVGSTVTVMVTCDQRVFMMDLSDVIAVPVKEAASKTDKVRTPREREVTYQEIQLRQKCQRNINIPTQAHKKQITSIEVKLPQVITHTQAINPFLVTLRWTDAVTHESVASTIHVFGQTNTNARGDNVYEPEDVWTVGHDSVAIFIDGPEPHVIYSVCNNDNNGYKDSCLSCCFEIRDYVNRRVLQRVVLADNMGIPVFLGHLKDVSFPTNDDNDEATNTTMLLVVDECGAMVAMDLVHNQCYPIDTALTRHLAFRPHSHRSLGKRGKLLLPSLATNHPIGKERSGDPPHKDTLLVVGKIVFSF